MTTKNSGGIVIFSTKGDIMFSSTGEITEHKKPPRKHRSQRIITHKIFEEMRSYTDNTFWDNLLMKFSRNIFHDDFRFVGNTLFYKYKSKNHREDIILNEKDLENSFRELQLFLKKKGILPVEEVVDDSKELLVPRKKIECWKEVGKNKIILLHNFLERLKDEYNLNDREYKKTESLLKLLIYSNILTKDHIILEDEEISYIKFFKWNDKNREFKVEMDKIKTKVMRNEKKQEEKFYLINSFSDDKNNFNKEIKIDPIDKKWESFLETYYKV